MALLTMKALPWAQMISSEFDKHPDPPQAPSPPPHVLRPALAFQADLARLLENSHSASGVKAAARIPETIFCLYAWTSRRCSHSHHDLPKPKSPQAQEAPKVTNTLPIWFLAGPGMPQRTQWRPSFPGRPYRACCMNTVPIKEKAQNGCPPADEKSSRRRLSRRARSSRSCMVALLIGKDLV